MVKCLFFKAPWCQTCHAIEDTVPDYIEHVDCEKNPELALEYSVVGLPTFVFISATGKELGKIQTSNIALVEKMYTEVDTCQITTP